MDFDTLHSRQAELVNSFIREISLLVIGGGGIGSNAIHQALSMGVRQITVVDYDVVAEENVFPGCFGQKDLSMPKTRALARMAQEDFGVTLNIYESMATDALNRLSLLRAGFGVVLVATDSLSSRQEAFDKVREDRMASWWMDGRMGGTTARVYCFGMDQASLNSEQVESYIDGFRLSPAELPCGQKATSPLTKGFIPGFVGQCLFDIANGSTPPFEQRYDLRDRIPIMIPFYT